LQAHYLGKVNNNVVTQDFSQLIVDSSVVVEETSTTTSCDQSTNWESLQEGEIIKVRFDVSEGTEQVYGKVKIVTNEYYYVDEWSDGDLKFRKISKANDDWQKAGASEYIPPIINKKQKRDSTVPTLGQCIRVPFYLDSTSNSYDWLQGEIKIERGSYWMVYFSDGEVYKILKNSKWSLVG